MIRAQPLRLASRRPRIALRSPTLLALETTLLALCVMVAWPLSALITDPAWSLLALANFVWLVTLMFRINPGATVLALPEIVSRSSTAVALVAIEYGSPIPELGMVGTPGIASSAFVAYTALFFGAFIALFRLVAGKPGRERTGPLTPLFDRYANWIALGLLAVTAFLSLWLVMRGLASGFPLLQGIDRFVYRRFFADKITIYGLNMKFTILFLLGMVAFRLPVRRELRLAAIAQTLALLFVYFLFADKFFTQLGGLAGFGTPYLYMNQEKVRRYVVAYVLAGAAALSVVFSVTWYIYSQGGAMTTAATMERLGGRIVGQGELWYLQTRIGAPVLDWQGDFVKRNVDALTIKEANLYAVQESLGPFFFSNRYAPENIRRSLIRNAGSVSYTAVFEAGGLAAFGWAGLAVLTVLSAGLIALLATYIAFAITSRSLVSALFSGYIAVFVRKSLTQFTPWVAFGLPTLRWFVLLGLIEVGLYAVGISQRRGQGRPARPVPGYRRTTVAGSSRAPKGDRRSPPFSTEPSGSNRGTT